MNIREMLGSMRNRLAPTVGDAEARAMANIIMEDVKGYSPTQLIVHGDRELLDETVERLDRIVERILAGEPMQYVIGSARFYGRDFKVGPGVLIPRPETGELIDLIIKDFGGRKGLNILDVGTGSGCIAITLAIELPFSTVSAIDISDDAIKTATANASKLKTSIKAYKQDAFNLSDSVLAKEEFDIIVSNPPYVLRSEESEMDPRVKDYEPATALFVDDSHPIDIYAAISRFASSCLKVGGGLYFEINPLCANEVRRMLLSEGFDDVNIHLDYRGKKRFASAIKK